MVAPLLALLLVSGAEPNEAEKLFRQMEAKLTKSKSCECAFEAKFELDESTGTMAGTFLFAEGNKFRVDMTSGLGGLKQQITTLSDGAKMVTIRDNKPEKPEDTPKWRGEADRVGLARAGLTIPGMRPNDPAARAKEFKADEEFALSDFKLGKKEMVGRQEAQAVEYTLAVKGAAAKFAVTVWIDTKTQAPVKRFVTASKGDGKLTITETYSKLELDGKIDPKRFELPKETPPGARRSAPRGGGQYVAAPGGLMVYGVWVLPRDTNTADVPLHVDAKEQFAMRLTLSFSLTVAAVLFLACGGGPRPPSGGHFGGPTIRMERAAAKCIQEEFEAPKDAPPGDVVEYIEWGPHDFSSTAFGELKEKERVWMRVQFRVVRDGETVREYDRLYLVQYHHHHPSGSGSILPKVYTDKTRDNPHGREWMPPAGVR